MRFFHFLCVMAACLGAQALANKTLTIDPTSNFGTWEGWGASLSWWAKAFGYRDDLADMFFSRRQHLFNGHVAVPGLGFNVVRYNAGASSYNVFQFSMMETSPNFRKTHHIEGFWLHWNEGWFSGKTWDWFVDPQQRAMMQKAKERGADVFELYSNSPMWWMCYNHNPSGSSGGTRDNLQSWNYDNHVHYLFEIAQQARFYWGITFQSIAPFNEPSSTWNGDNGTQEGCFYSPSTMDNIIHRLRDRLSDTDSPTFISGVEEHSYDRAISTWRSLNQTTKRIVKRINVHGYQGQAGGRDELYRLARATRRRLWMSEYEDEDETGVIMLMNIFSDFASLHPTAWVYRQVVDDPYKGLIVGDKESLLLGIVNLKYFVLAQVSRHIRPGMRILANPDNSSIAAYDASKKKLAIVAANWHSAPTRNITFDLSRFGKLGPGASAIPRWSTEIGGTDRYVKYNDTKMTGGRFTVEFQYRQVQSFEVDDVTL
ncbi:glycoside hydrolase family 30 protein [Purpureocillium lavendulum]|uniref:Glycoside hydrolase family 30 protein n=1 Tax=Purpureocillium lavendulum TaxID=1247861 RepID=A0AB34FL25_9HYPO|nr:glycoside hydrolase family 30 protein [Purpureocillium lavendulum]